MNTEFFSLPIFQIFGFDCETFMPFLENNFVSWNQKKPTPNSQFVNIRCSNFSK